MVVLQGVHHDVGTWSAVVDIAQNVQLVDGQPLYDFADGRNEVVGTSGRDDRLDDGAHIVGLVLVIRMFVQQLLYDIGEICRQGFAYLRAGVFTGHVAAHLYQTVDGDVIPVLYVLFLVFDEFQFLFRIVDQGTQFALFCAAEGVAEELVYFSLDVSRGILQHVLEGLVFTVYVGKEVLRALREVCDGFKVDNLRGGIGNIRERFCQQLQIPLVFLQIVMFVCHVLMSLGEILS